jgi:hypothetical protein
VHANVIPLARTWASPDVRIGPRGASWGLLYSNPSLRSLAHAKGEIVLHSAAPFAYQPWPPDDTEESVMGTDQHQMTILNLRLGTNEAAQRLARMGEPPP